MAIFGAPETLCRYRHTLERDDFGEEVLGRSTLAGGYAFLLEGNIPVLILRALHLVVMDPREADAQGGSGVVMNKILLVSTELDNADKKQRSEMK